MSLKQNNPSTTNSPLLSAEAEAMNGQAIEAIQHFTVVKRDGRIVPFRKERIVKALEAAFRDTKKIAKTEPLTSSLTTTLHAMTEVIIAQLFALAQKGVSLSVEGIQDIVEVSLMKQGFHDIARDYIIYRDQHKALREDSVENVKIYRDEQSTPVRFHPGKIASSLENIFRKYHAIEGQTPDAMINTVNTLTQNVINATVTLAKSKKNIHIHDIQNLIEEELMRSGFFAVAKSYILSRSLEGSQVETSTISFQESVVDATQRKFHITDKEGSVKTISERDLFSHLQHVCRGFTTVSAKELLEASLQNFYEGMKEEEIDSAYTMAARAKIEKEPAYACIAARLLLDSLYRETLNMKSSDRRLKKAHEEYFAQYIRQAVSIARLSPALLDFDLPLLAKAMRIERDDQFNYLGLQTLYDRYFIHQEQKRLETPQIFWMRVAMGLSLNEQDKNGKAIEFYHVFSEFLYIPGTPTLFNSGTKHSQLSSCYLSTIMDDLSHIFKVIADDAQLSKWAGGIGNDWTNVRATGAFIQGTNGQSQGIIPFLKVANDTAVAVNQCFDPDTRIFTHKGIKPIANVAIGDLVLGVSGTYKAVTDRYVYEQKEPMVEIDVKHSIGKLKVTAGHPFLVIRGVPMKQANTTTLAWLSKGKICSAWVEAGQLQKGDFIAQVIPKETVVVPDFHEDDARVYGILLGDGHLTKDGFEWGVSGSPEADTHLEFIREYLRQRGIHFWETSLGSTYVQIHWASGRGAVRDATTGRIVGSGAQTMPFAYDDLYDSHKNKWIAPRFSHLPKKQTLMLLQGLLETDGHVSRGKELVFTNTSLPLIEGIRYQALRLGVPTAGNYRLRTHDHSATWSDDSKTAFSCQTGCYDLRIPAFPELSQLLGCTPITKHNWLTVGGCVYSRVSSVVSAITTPFVCDLQVEGDASYMTTAGLAHNGGKRKGAMCAYLETWHLDIEDFLELRKNTGDDRRRTHDMNTANWIPDLFMKRVEQNGMWTLFSPNDVPDLHDLYGERFEKRYQEYESMVDSGKLKLFKKIEAVQLWRKMLSMLFETGHPWITFKDPSNIRSPQDHVGVVHSSNLCTEILLNSSATETAVCNLGSINLANHMQEDGLDEKKIAATVKTAIRILDNVIDINFYPTVEARNSNHVHRPVGLGLMGFQDALYHLNVSYASHEAVTFSDKSMEMISYYAILASSELAKERGTYGSYQGSKWDRGYLPIDTIDLLEKERGMLIDIDRSISMDWTPVRQSVKKYGMRNSNTMAIAPTATIANIIGVISSIEPSYNHLYVKSNLSGEFTVVNTYLVETLKSIGLWDEQMIDDLKYFDGSIMEIERIPEEIKRVFLTAFEVEPDWIIECGARRQKWIDMGESLNLYLAEPSGKKLDQMYRLAWNKGLKTTYYLRSLGATQIEKSTTDINKRGLQPRWMKNDSPSARIKVDREAPVAPQALDSKPMVCSLEEGCESCQ